MFLLLKKLSTHISIKRRYQLILLFFLMVCSSFLEVVSIGSIMPFLTILSSPDKIFNSEYAQFIINVIDIKTPNDLIIPITLFFSLTILISGLIKMLLLWVQLRVTFSIGSDFSIDMYKRTLYQSYEVHLSRNSSEVITGISGKSKALISGTLMPILALISNLILSFSILFILFYINPTVTFITIGFFSLLYFLILKLTKNKLNFYGYIISKQHVKVLKLLQEGIGGIRDIILDGTQEYQSKQYKKTDEVLRKAQAGVQIISNSPRFIIETIGMLAITYFAYYLSIKDEGLSGSLPVLGAMALGAQRLLPTLQQIYSSVTLLRADKSTLTDALIFLEQPLPSKKDNSNKNFKFEKDIVFKSLSFKYNLNSPVILEDINFKISKGSRLGVIGSSGSGKSTFLDLLMGLLIPSQGNIIIDDCPINLNNINSWQSILAHVPQSIYLADTSIAENIAFGVNPSQIDFQKVKEAASKAQIADIVETWDKKYDTIVGERGARLSGGQKQRIGIARALYKDAKVIIFDEATSALDNDTEAELMESIYGLGEDLTLIIVAHRLSTLKNCTQIIEINNRSILKLGMD
jgi:ABC-type bacteriocin/lantibiotic exporter with double-glycine peptidase domain